MRIGSIADQASLMTIRTRAGGWSSHILIHPFQDSTDDRIFTLEPLLRCESAEAALAFALPCPLLLAVPLRAGVVYAQPLT